MVILSATKRPTRNHGMRCGVQLYGAFGGKGMNVFLMKGPVTVVLQAARKGNGKHNLH